MLLLAAFGLGFELMVNLEHAAFPALVPPQRQGGMIPTDERTSSMASDPRVAAAISHWAPRFVANGVALSDFEDVTGSHQVVGRLVRRLVGARGGA